MKTFEIGKEYFDTSACDHNCVYVIKIIKRTEKTITFLRDGEEKRTKLFADKDGEYIMPDRYSMAPVFRATREYLREEKAPSGAETSKEHPTADNVTTISQSTDGVVVVMLGQRVELNCGALIPVQTGTIIRFVERKPYPFSRSTPCALIRWDDEEEPGRTSQIPISDIHPRGWRSSNGSPIGCFIAG